MQSIIRVLDEHTINQIAAGEVIENPASVVKELVDNAIDSTATEIVVEITSGGRQLIRVTDNGCGMSPDDAILSFERHATSKIKSLDDIANVSSMGFRGEAVPSIASISKYTLLTRPEKEAKGTMVVVDGGKMIKSCDASCQSGTTVEVKSLFFNVPVRKKFQRSPNYDIQEIVKILSKLSLAHPNIKFELISNQQQILRTKKNPSQELKEQLSERALDVLGKEFLDQSSYVCHQQKECSVYGFLGLPVYAKHNRSRQYLFVNKRPVFSSLLQQVIREGYGTTLPTNRHPQFLLYVDLAGDLIDVNVHPQKHQVRIRQEELLKQTVSQAIDKALHSFDTVSFSTSAQDTFDKEEFSTSHSSSFAGFSLSPSTFSRPITKSVQEASCVSFDEPVFVSQEKHEQMEFLPKVSERQVPQVIGKIPGYVLLKPLSGSGGFDLMNQKFAHARIIFEKIKAEQASESIVTQTLLVPYTLELNRVEAEVLKQKIDDLCKLGIHIKEFGKLTYVIDAIPEIFGDIDIEGFIQELVENFSETENSSFYQIESKIAMMASRAALCSKSELTDQEALHLTNQLFLCEHPLLCPFGKPTIVNLSQEYLAKTFNRFSSQGA